jgi:hypothetical protein
MTRAYLKRDIVQMAKGYNKTYPMSKINLKQKKRDLFDSLVQNQSKNVELSQGGAVPRCVLKSLDAMKDDFNKSWGPTKSGEWLKTNDINTVIQKYQYKYPQFEFLGTVPLDFQKIYPEMYHLDVSKDKSKSIFGLVINTDPSDKPGQHWVALTIDKHSKTICYFDSTGSSPPKQIYKFLRAQSKKTGFPVLVNFNVHQKGGGACGLYVINFIVSRIKGQSCSEYFNCIKTVKQMEKTRKMIF